MRSSSVRTFQAAFLDTYRPPITVSEYFTCRRDCAAVYALQVELVPDGQEKRISNNVVPRDHWGDDLPEQQDVTTNKSVAQIHRMEQWSSKFYSLLRSLIIREKAEQIELVIRALELIFISLSSSHFLICGIYNED